MKVLSADLLNDVVSSYDQTKTTVQGRAQLKTVDGDLAIGPPLNRFIDAFTEATFTLTTNATYLTPNGRLFSVQAETGGLSVIVLYNVNLTTGVPTYVGRIQIALPDFAATTHTFRSLKVIDSGTSGWKIVLTTSASVLINGGTFVANNIALSDFVPTGFPTIPFANGSDQKAVYFIQDPSAIGVNQLQVASVGAALDTSNSRLYVHNGVSATHQYYVYDLTATLNCPTDTGITGVAATDIINHTNSFLDNDPITFTAITGGAGLVANAVYFVRNRTSTSYQVSATSGGAAINFTTDISNATVCRAYGTTGSAWLYKTGNLPVLTGTLLSSDSEDYVTPAQSANAGQPCVFFATQTNLYLGRISELTTGATSWPSLQTVNSLGTTNQITTPTIAFATWSEALDKAIYLTNGSLLIIKNFVNNSISTILGGSNNRFLETLVGLEVVELQTLLVSALTIRNGWIVLAGGTSGQRGFYLADLRSDAAYDFSYVVTKVMPLQADKLRFITTLDKLFDFTGSLDVYYRTSGFGSITGGWINIPFAGDLSSFAPGSQIQFKIAFSTLGLDTSIPAQLCEFLLGYDGKNEVSEHWEYSDDDSSSGNPTDIVWRLKKAYLSSIPTLRFLANDLTNSVVTDHDSVTNVANFAYSTNNGVSYVSFGTPPNTVGTLVRYRYSTPPGVDIRPSLKEA